tara:strand:+ start:1287 stop:1397 length:111 start_codon:yes stop_codon:yes gene_type:complete
MKDLKKSTRVIYWQGDKDGTYERWTIDMVKRFITNT